MTQTQGKTNLQLAEWLGRLPEGAVIRGQIQPGDEYPRKDAGQTMVFQRFGDNWYEPGRAPGWRRNDLIRVLGSSLVQLVPATQPGGNSGSAGDRSDGWPET